MSWQDYVDKQLLATKCITKAVIAGHDGNIWAKSEGFEPSKDELKKIAEVMPLGDGGEFHQRGLFLVGMKYIYLSGTDKVMRAKQGKIGVHCVMTQQALIVSLYEEPIQPQQAASVVEKLGDYLVTCGY